MLSNGQSSYTGWPTKDEPLGSVRVPLSQVQVLKQGDLDGLSGDLNPVGGNGQVTA